MRGTSRHLTSASNGRLTRQPICCRKSSATSNAAVAGVIGLSDIMKITDFLIMDSEGNEVAADPFGNNLAFTCMDCGHPILAIALENQRGNSESSPVFCKGCEASYFMDIRVHAKKIYVHPATAQ